MIAEQLIQTSIDHASLSDDRAPSQRTLGLYAGSVLALSNGANTAVTHLAVITEPDTYSPIQGDVLADLAERGIHVDSLLQKATVDLRPTYPCWVSENMPPSLSLPFGQLLVFEMPSPHVTELPHACWKLFRALQAATRGQPASLAVQVGGPGWNEADTLRLLRMLFFAAVRYGGVTEWELQAVKLFIDPAYATSARAQFQAWVTAYENPPVSVPLDTKVGPWSEDPERRKRALADINDDKNTRDIGLVPRVTERQLNVVVAWTGNAIYRAIRETLSDTNIDKPDFVYFQPTIVVLSTALANLRDYICADDDPVFRGTHLLDKGLATYTKKVPT
ncbi:hypothetical protein [Paraburkholderia caffeinilytica]|uniref:hypothetical protein n=1 Tax=Paraburkholderia caffeinilytica TaxID=1761016 RepID=UPI003DA03D8A